MQDPKVGSDGRAETDQHQKSREEFVLDFPPSVFWRQESLR